MNKARVIAIFSLIVGAGCGPAESLPPVHDAGPPVEDAGNACDGQCVPIISLAWDGPTLVWIGAEADAPPCPAAAFFETYTGHGYASGNLLCGTCSCDPPDASCALPKTLTAAAASCSSDGEGVPHTSFDAPSKWDGTCTTANAIAAGALCGGVPCVQSVTIAPLTLIQGGCLPTADPGFQPPSWTTFARACIGARKSGDCKNAGEHCAPATTAPGFKQCISRDGDPAAPTLKCPVNYPERHVFYDAPTPYCSPCTCGVPTGVTCTGSISISQNGACGTPPLVKVSIDSKGPTCVDVPAGSALGSKTASAPIDSGGYCKPSGGAPQGNVFCCLP